MKKIILLMLLAALTTTCFGAATPYNIYGRPTEGWLSGATPNKDPAWAWMKAVDRLVAIRVDQGTVYYVDNNSGADTHDGLSWDHAFLTIAVALAASHADIATSPNYADRNTIFVRGDDFDEDLTKLSQKTDVIGVGSDDGNKGPRLAGNHVIEAVGSGNYMGCRFINMTFVNQTSGPIFTLPTGQHGIEFVYCKFENSGATGSSTGILSTANNDLKILGCSFVNSGTGFTTGAISIGAGSSERNVIADNWIDSEIGIVTNSSTTGVGNRIQNNTIYATTLTIDENSDVFFIINNTLITAGRKEQAFDWNMSLANNNRVTHAGGTVMIPYPDVPVTPLGARGKIYYVDGNMSSTGGDGLTWETAMKSLVTALAASHADIATARNWANRNTIYVSCDSITEDFTKFAQKTDVVGVGSMNSYKKAQIIGTWAIPDTVNYMGCRFYNLQFYDDDAGGVLFDIDTQSGTQFHNCTFFQNATDTIAILLEECGLDVLIDKCDFTWTNQNGWSTAAIQVADDTDVPTGIKITNNYIRSGAIGIDWDETNSVDCWVTDNRLTCTGMPIDDEGDDIVAINNMMITNIDTSTWTNGFDFNLLLAAGNLLVGSAGECDSVPVILQTGN